MSDTYDPTGELSLDALRQRAQELEQQLGAVIPNFCDKHYVERKASEHPDPDPEVRMRAATGALCRYYESLIALRERDPGTWERMISWN